MGYYIGTFLSSLLFVYLAERLDIKERKKLNVIILLIISILIMSIIAGLRAETVGIDISYYIVPQVKLASGFSSFLQYFNASNLEVLYSLLIFLCTRLSDDMGFVLFFTELAVCIPVFLSVYKLRNKISMTYAILVFDLLFYNLTLNIMRQGIAASLLLLAVVCLIEDNSKIKFTILSLLAVGFHSSAIFAIIFLIIILLNINRSIRLIWQIATLVITIGIILNIEKIVSIIGIYNIEYYQRFIYKFNGTGLNAFEVLLRGLLIFIPLLIIMKSKQKNILVITANFIVIIGFVISFSALISDYMIRMSYYFEMFYVLSIPLALKNISNKNVGRMIVSIFMAVILILYWYVIYIGWNWHSTMPYIFR